MTTNQNSNFDTELFVSLADKFVDAYRKEEIFGSTREKATDQNCTLASGWSSGIKLLCKLIDYPKVVVVDENMATQSSVMNLFYEIRAFRGFLLPKKATKK
jgi:hypothetical protein